MIAEKQSERTRLGITGHVLIKIIGQIFGPPIDPLIRSYSIIDPYRTPNCTFWRIYTDGLSSVSITSVMLVTKLTCC